MPRCLGRFKNAPVLDCVCDDCNQFFGDELELFLASDSIEAVLRVRHGVGTRADAQKLKNARITVRVTQPGDWYGARLELTHDSSLMGFKATPPPQVALRIKGDPEWRWFFEEELRNHGTFERYHVSPGNLEIKIVGDGARKERLLDKLGSVGINFRERGKISPPETHSGLVETWVESSLDDIILRAVAKIAFNYLAFAQGPELALREDFDEFRAYVRYGARPTMPVVIISKHPILQGDDKFYRQTNGHVVVLDWDMTGMGIVCLVSLFNHLTYHASLCKNFSGVWRPLSQGLHFDPQSGNISHVGGVSLSLKSADAV